MALQTGNQQSLRYERPNRPWVCGRLAEGRPCHAGPAPGGHCRGGFECEPRRAGDRWECTRSVKGGGKCDNGPLPNGQCCQKIELCVPVRGQRSRRARAARWLVLAVIGVMASIVGGTALRPWVSPGPISFHHAMVEDCTSCHATFGAGPIDWVHKAFAPSDPAAEAKQCTVCHALGTDALVAHSLRPAQLAALRTAADRKKLTAPVPPRLALALTLFPVSEKHQDELACRTCHTEHGGADGLLTKMSDQQCQSCHSVRFASLAQGHPEFDRYPYERRTRIVFDHALHYGRHFAESKAKGLAAPEACADCHQLESTGKLEDVKPFAQACATCHLGDIRGEAAGHIPGLPIVMIPALDIKTLAKSGGAVGEWPGYADTELNRTMWMLIGSDPSVAKDFATLGPIGIGDLSQASPAQLAAAEHVAWAIKEFLYDALVDGAPALEKRLTQAFGPGLDHATMANMLAGLPQQVLLDAAKFWFPHLMTEVPRHRAGESMVTMAVLPPREAAGASSPAPQSPPASSAPAAPPGKADDHGDILGGGGDILGGAAVSGDGAGTAPAAKGTGADQSSILGGDDILGSDATAKPDAKPVQTAKPAASPDQGSILGGDDILSGGAPSPAAAPAPAAAKREAKPLDTEAWSQYGGWYRVDYTIYYRPVGHEDSFMRSWLDATAPHVRPDYASWVFYEMIAADAPGQCAKCHSIDAGIVKGSHIVNWQPRRVEPDRRDFTTFDHTPHIGAKGDEDCHACHDMKAGVDVLATYKQDDPMHFAAGFESLSRKVCATCHVQGKADAACTDCHNYHVGVFSRGNGALTGQSSISGRAE